MEDNKIVQLYWDRDERAIQETEIKYSKLLFHIASNILHSYQDSQECVNDTYRKAWESMPPTKPNSLTAFLGRITRNLSFNLWNNKHAQKRDCQGDVLLCELAECIGSENTLHSVEFRSLVASINCWLSTLAEDDRILFVKRYWLGDSLQMLANESNATPSTISSRLFRLRTKLKKILIKESFTI